MGWTIEFLPETQILRVTTAGTMGLEQIKQMAAEGMAAGVSHAATRFLVDHRKMLPSLSHEDIFDLPRINAEQGVARTMRVAIVFSPDSPRREDFFFYEVRTRSKGASNIRQFDDYDQALDWLLAG